VCVVAPRGSQLPWVIGSCATRRPPCTRAPPLRLGAAGCGATYKSRTRSQPLSGSEVGTAECRARIPRRAPCHYVPGTGVKNGHFVCCAAIGKRGAGTGGPAGQLHNRRSDAGRFPSSERQFDSRHPLHEKAPSQRPGLLCCLDQFRYLVPYPCQMPGRPRFTPGARVDRGRPQPRAAAPGPSADR